MSEQPAVIKFDTQDALEDYVEEQLNENGITPSVALIDSDGVPTMAHRTAPGGDGYGFEFDNDREADNGFKHCCQCEDHQPIDCPELDWTWRPRFPIWVFDVAGSVSAS